MITSLSIFALNELYVENEHDEMAQVKMDESANLPEIFAIRNNIFKYISTFWVKNSSIIIVFLQTSWVKW